MVGVAASGSTLSMILGCLVVGGFGFSVLNPATGKAIVDWFPPRHRGTAMGIKQTGLTLGGVLASLSLPPIAIAYDWRRALLTAAGVAIATGAIVAFVYRRPPAPSSAPSAPQGTVREAIAFLRRPGVVVVFLCGFTLSIAQSSQLAYLALYAKETFGFGAVAAGQMHGGS